MRDSSVFIPIACRPVGVVTSLSPATQHPLPPIPSGPCSFTTPSPALNFTSVCRALIDITLYYEPNKRLQAYFFAEAAISPRLARCRQCAAPVISSPCHRQIISNRWRSKRSSAKGSCRRQKCSDRSPGPG